MRFWITKNGEVPVKEQLVRQVLLGILSADLPAGQKLPSVRALARRHRIHSNTVSAAYHDLLERGWLELRRGSGLYVRPVDASVAAEPGLDNLLTTLLQAAARRGHEPDEVLRRLEQLVRPRNYDRILVVEPEPGLRAILCAEIAEQIRTSVESIEPGELSGVPNVGRYLIVTLATQVAVVRRNLPRGAVCVPLRLRSVPAELDGQARPRPNALVSVISRSAQIRFWARIMLIAVGLDPLCLCEIDPREQDWRPRLAQSALVVTDIAMAAELPPGCPAKVFRVVADSSIVELKQLCDASPVTPRESVTSAPSQN
jgi:GntR family transcriptional regulator